MSVNGILQKRHYSKKIKDCYRALGNLFMMGDVIDLCYVSYIIMPSYGIYQKVILGLM